MSLQAYQRAQQATESPRQTEYRLFAQVTGALMQAKEKGVKDNAFFTVLDWNRRMWTTLATDCASAGNGLPEQVRAQIISISIWVNKYTSAVAQQNADMQALIDVNRTIMEGLAQ